MPSGAFFFTLKRQNSAFDAEAREDMMQHTMTSHLRGSTDTRRIAGSAPSDLTPSSRMLEIDRGDI
jgi:hypothetical protein